MKLAGRVLVFLVPILTIAGCDGSPLSPLEQRELAAARNRWAREGSADYTVESRISCFCAPHVSVWTRLTVRAGVIVAADPIGPTPDWFEPSLTGWQTVEEFFASITNRSDYVRELKARYDTELGYPREIDLTCHDNIMDCGSHREMRNLQIP